MKSKVDGVLKKVIAEFALIKFESYRIALKLGKIQDIYCFELINIEKLMVELENKNIQIFETINLYHLTDIIKNAIEKNDSLSIKKINEIAEIAATFTFKIFESTENVVKICDFLLFFNILSYHGLKSKFKSIFEIYANPVMQTINWLNLQQFIKSKKRLLQAINEKPKLIQERSIQGFSLTQDEFIKQAGLEFIGVMHRLKYASRTWHDVACSVCRVRPMVGMRFQCLKCFNYDTCQVCFLLQKVAGSHKMTHPQQEYCVRAGSKEKISSVARTIRNNVTKKYKQVVVSSEQASKSISDQSSSEANSEVEKTLPDSPNTFLCNQINKLVLEENVKLKRIVERFVSIF